jgi:hypothetical protein
MLYQVLTLKLHQNFGLVCTWGVGLAGVGWSYVVEMAGDKYFLGL